MPSDKSQNSSWPVQDAKARFSEMLNTCLSEGPQVVTRHGKEMAVLVPAAEWRRVAASSRRTLKDLLLADDGRGDLDVPPRGKLKMREARTIE